MTATHPARGMRDFLPGEVRRRQHVVSIIARVYEQYGFEPLETPAVENIETLLGKYGEEGDRLIFRILKRGEGADRGEADLALRYDLTVPLARVIAEHRGTLPRFFKRYQIQPVWRADRPQRGRFREFYQCDVDAIGSRSPVVEAELCAAAAEALARLGFSDFAIRLNHRQVLAGVLEASGVPGNLQGAALVALDKIDKIDRDGVAGELADRGVPAAAAASLLDLCDRFGLGARGSARAADQDEVLRTLSDRVAGLPAARAAVENLAEIVALCAGTPAAGRLRLDPALARGLSYYTGAIMEIAVPDLAGSLGGGGRYDGLVGMFLGEDVPAAGFSLGLERILVVMADRSMFPPHLTSAPADVMVTLWSTAGRAAAVSLAGELRAAGLRVEVYPEADRIGKQLKYAAGRGVPLVAVLGDDEAARGEVSIKDLRSGEQHAVPRPAVATALRDRLAALPVPGGAGGAASTRG